MEQIVTMPIIVEFNGLPGSGKTTIADELKKKIEKTGCEVSNSYFKRRYHRYGVLVILNPSYWKLIKSIIKYSKLFEEKKSLSMILHVVSFVRSYHDFIRGKKKEVLIVDQGFVQGIISLAHQELLPQTSCLDDILKISNINSNAFVCVNCNVNEVISDERITRRPMNGCRVESMEKNERMKTLAIQKENFSFLRKSIIRICPNIICVDIDTENNVLDNVENIFKTIASNES